MNRTEAQTATDALRAAVPYATVTIELAARYMEMLPETDQRWAVCLDTLLCSYRTTDLYAALAYARAGGQSVPQTWLLRHQYDHGRAQLTVACL